MNKKYYCPSCTGKQENATKTTYTRKELYLIMDNNAFFEIKTFIGRWIGVTKSEALCWLMDLSDDDIKNVNLTSNAADSIRIEFN